MEGGGADPIVGTEWTEGRRQSDDQGTAGNTLTTHPQTGRNMSRGAAGRHSRGVERDSPLSSERKAGGGDGKTGRASVERLGAGGAAFRRVIRGLSLGEKFGRDTGFHRRTVGGHCWQMPAGGAKSRAAASARQEVGEHVELKIKQSQK